MYSYFKLVSLFVLTCRYFGQAQNADETNATEPKDMYVIHASVYQVGILTNQTDGSDDPHSGREETITFYRNNGSSIDLNTLPKSLMTNVTAENAVGVAPADQNATLAWTPLNNIRDVNESEKLPIKIKRAIENETAQIIQGAAVIPPVAGVQSILLPPLLALNKNITEVPVPIPNVSVVKYAKVNTLVHSP